MGDGPLHTQAKEADCYVHVFRCIFGLYIER